MYLKTLNSCVGVSLLEKSSPVRPAFRASNKRICEPVCCFRLQLSIRTSETTKSMSEYNPFIIVTGNLFPAKFLSVTFYFLIQFIENRVFIIDNKQYTG